MKRRIFLALMAAALSRGAAAQPSGHAVRDLYPRTYDDGIIPNFSLELIEISAGTDISVALLDTASARSVQWNDTARINLDGTVSLLLAAAVLRRVAEGRDVLDRDVPAAEGLIGQKMTVDALCAAMMTRGDSTAASLVLGVVGGSDGLTSFLRDIGDVETEVAATAAQGDDATPGSIRGTTTPCQMLRNLERLLLGDGLTADGKARLLDWKTSNTTGASRLRAGSPEGWIVADVTGQGAYGETSALAAIFPPDRTPLLMAVYFGRSPRAPGAQDRYFAELARIATDNIQEPMEATSHD
ncbi:serine hydrolase [Roseicyclus mahoneyensis]|uniref:beta-lactamase n=1 Tax=Roseicyclus mahoneyensis TaxID=164332 RepID=A0A316GX55_9RHOB|nr:serine hydrolase [Roseicyclus mahoneyensis]PWK59659.1 beta-lactamase class A [Roseicyclus mahoneyensis]